MILIDYFLDKDALKPLNDRQLWIDSHGAFRWFDKSEPKNVWETFIENATKRLEIYDDVVGFEWWVVACVINPDTFDSKDGVYSWHQDVDETTDDLLPEWSCTYYGYPHCLWGGFSEYQVEESRTEVERFAPFYNRLIFNETPGRYHRVSRVWKGERYALAFAGWKEKPPLFKDNDMHRYEDIPKFKWIYDNA